MVKRKKCYARRTADSTMTSIWFFAEIDLRRSVAPLVDFLIELDEKTLIQHVCSWPAAVSGLPDSIVSGLSRFVKAAVRV
jgi:hypothetical protein